MTATDEQTPLYKKTESALLEFIKRNEFQDNKLPSEEALCELMGVSRTTLREALMTLTRMGVISKVHGSGNLIHRSTLRTRMRIDTNINFRDLLEDGGYKVSCRTQKPRWMKRKAVTDIDVSDLEEERFLQVAHTYFADGRPAIYSHNYLCGTYIVEGYDVEQGDRDNFAELLANVLSEQVVNSLNHFKPAQAEEALAKRLHIEPGSSLIQWYESYISTLDHVLCRSVISFNPDLVTLSLLRKWT